MKTNAVLFLMYAILISTLSFFHEFWRDELQAYMLVKSSNSISELIYNCRYEGHPSLWFLLLFALKFIAPGLLPVKILHLLIAALSGWLIIKYSPFKTAQKALLLFGYFFFYEYVFIVRNYALGILFIIIFCVLFPYRKSPRHFIFLALSVVGMMLSNFYSFIIGLACMALLASEHLFYREGTMQAGKLLPGYALMLAGLILFVVDIIPPADYGYAYKWNITLNTEDILYALGRVWQVFIPIPDYKLQFWNSSFITDINLQALFGALILGSVVFVFAEKRLSRLFILLCFILILGFSYLKFNGYLRHNGHLYIAFIAMLWLQHYLPGKESAASKTRDILLYSLLGIQSAAMLMAVAGEVMLPFSESKNAATYISANHRNKIIVANLDVGASSVSAWLDTALYYPSSNSFGTYIIWNRKRAEQQVTTALMVHKADSLSQLYKKQVLYLFTYPPDSADHYGLQLQNSFRHSIEPAESYYLYTK